LVTDQAKDLLAERGFDKQFGARPLRRVIQADIEDPLSDELLRITFSPGDLVTIDVEDGKIRTHVVPGPPPPTEAVEEKPPAVEPAGAGAAGPSGGDGGGPV
jgi:hypothetical protein